MDPRVQAEVVVKTLRKIVAALKGVGHEPVVIGALAHQAWGAKSEPQGVDLLVSSGEAQRAAIFSAARGEGLQQMPASAGMPPLRLSYADAKLGATANVDLQEAATPFLKQAVGRAKPAIVRDMQLLLATCEDLVLLRAGSALPADRESMIQILRGNAGRIDAQYLKREAEAAGVFDRVKSAWAEAKQRP